MYGKKKFIALIVAVSIIGCGLMLPTTANAAEKTQKRELRYLICLVVKKPPSMMVTT